MQTTLGPDYDDPHYVAGRARKPFAHGTQKMPSNTGQLSTHGTPHDLF
jgi:hypothetical protein